MRKYTFRISKPFLERKSAISSNLIYSAPSSIYLVSNSPLLRAVVSSQQPQNGLTLPLTGLGAERAAGSTMPEQGPPAGNSSLRLNGNHNTILSNYLALHLLYISLTSNKY